ncbi:hypothetical protein P170DRAFT_465142 [Aspergillus steynii IBT 23096]|uniref:F-box domain-containing protein n=1 Tax=Aspergillus steynii IBT 23096 TaxID=1392250 RepID=A0A2I2G3J7_9EURO|nr:uncharacterized protein P170DRAFT_465142 [Aspergillus steynii IBT 23096]PLB47456.1 hypothetical protein P170DRAFT_465142 [Aspergillus steynii IBT 23096]
MTLEDGPEFPFFCHICGAPPTWRGLLADSTLQYLDPEEEYFDQRAYRYMDFMPGQRKFGYDVRLLPPKQIRWLDAVRLVTNKIMDSVRGTETEVPVPLLTRLALHVHIDNGAFCCPDNDNDSKKFSFMRCNVDGYLVHDTCFKMLERVHQHLQATWSTQDLDLGRLWNLLQLGLEDRNNDLVDWGFGDAFHGSDRGSSGARFNPYYQEWHPVKGSMWAVMDPEGPFNCQPLLDRASASTQPGYSFTFSVKPTQPNPPAHLHPEPNMNFLSLLPYELQLSILELLPSSSVLSLLLASPDFRRCAEHLSSGFWKSRLFFDVPWCADIISAQIEAAQGNET